MLAIAAFFQGCTALPEKNDCTVRALARATGASYPEVHARLKEAGRPDGKGFDLTGFLEKNKLMFGHRIEPLNVPPQKLGEVRKHFRTGRLIFSTWRHAFASRDGILVDAGPDSQVVRNVWRVSLAR